MSRLFRENGLNINEILKVHFLCVAFRENQKEMVGLGPGGSSQYILAASYASYASTLGPTSVLVDSAKPKTITRPLTPPLVRGPRRRRMPEARFYAIWLHYS